MAAIVGTPDGRTFGAWDGDTLVAGANLFVNDGVASLNTGATRPQYRNRGAQSALIAARVAAAREAGAQLVVAEAAEPEPGGHNPSLANLLRAGLAEQYVRHTWKWRNPARG